MQIDNPDQLRDELRQIVGDTGLISDDQSLDYTIDCIQPKVVVCPTSVLEMQEVISLALRENLSVTPAGAGTKLGIGNLASKNDIVLSTTRFNKVIEYEPADLTVTVEAGIRLTDLQKELGVNHQFLPVNPPYADRCTIGGVVSTNSSGPLRLQYGTSRNLVLGMKVLLANGNVVKCGGKVVKNVAGYDLNRLYIGSYGTLGIITEVSLKLSPLPSNEKILVGHFDSIVDTVNAGLRIVSSQTLPSFVILSTKSSLNQFAEVSPTLIVGFGGDAEAISWQISKAQSLLEQDGVKGVQFLQDDSYRHIYNEIQEYAEVKKSHNHLIVKVLLKRTDILGFIEVAKNISLDMMILLGNGIVYMKIPLDADIDFQTVAESLTNLRQQVMKVNGYLIIESAPIELKQVFDIWGRIGNTLHLMQQLKAKFDSQNIFNPGRYVSKI